MGVAGLHGIETKDGQPDPQNCRNPMTLLTMSISWNPDAQKGIGQNFDLAGRVAQGQYKAQWLWLQ
jgi:hypothetical protein